MQQLALAFEARHLRAAPDRPRRRLRGLRLEGRPTSHRDLKPYNVPAGYRGPYVARLASALRMPQGRGRLAALEALADPAPFDLEADRAEEAAALSWGRVAHSGRADQGAE